MKQLRFFAAAGALCAALLVTLVSGRLEAAEGPMIRINNGPISGLEIDGIKIFKGIPYAKPPVGEFRFAPPQELGSWLETLKCEEFGPAPLQPTFGGGGGGGEAMSEDCLTLNVWVPEGATPDSKLPVYMFIHGGAYAIGGSANPGYDGMAFAKSGVVMVTVNYRLNALGFLSSIETLKRYGSTGNWGHLDQIKALEWIRDNIAHFGGDPDNVTVGGESAGAYSTSALILSPLAKGLFNKAILESGSVLAGPQTNTPGRGDLMRSINMSMSLAERFGVLADDAAGLEKLRAADASALAQLSCFNPDFNNALAFLFFPAFDGRMLPADPRQALEDGDFNKVSLLFGFNRDEGSMFVPAYTGAAHYRALAYYLLGDGKAQAYLSKFPVDAKNDALSRTRDLVSLAFFQGPTKIMGDALSAHGQAVYGYYFTYVAPDDAERGLGARHAAEMAYAFNNLAGWGYDNPTPEQLALAEEMHARWVNFIKSGDPNKGLLTPSKAPWPRYDPKVGNFLRFDAKVGVEIPPLGPAIKYMLDLTR